MRALDRKLVRNLATMKGQVIAIVLIVACGVASFVTVVTAYRGLGGSLDAYYRRYRMADVFAPVKRAPRQVLDEIQQIDGVRAAEGRIVFDVTIDLADLPQPVSGRVVSVPDRHGSMLNDLYLVRGRWFEGEGTRQVIVSDRFARAHGLDVGDRLSVLMNDKKEALTVVATALSPEFVYLIREGEIAPDPEHFAVLWMARSFAEAVFDFDEAVNDVVVTESRGAKTAEVIDGLDRVLHRYGAYGAYRRADQASHRFVSNEIDGLEASATVTPSIFLAVAAFVLHLLMGRLVQTQRNQIAVFRAFGYGRGDLARHYLKLALLVGLVGAALGIGIGLWFARQVLEMYREFFDFPVLAFGVDPVAVGAGGLVALGAAALGALGAARRAARLEPAEGLQPEAPPVYRPAWVERITWLWGRLGFGPRMVLRRLARTKARAAATVAGVALAVSILVLTFFSYDSYGVMIDDQFRLIERQDVRVTFHAERGRAALYEVRRLAGVRRAEAEWALPVRLVHGWRSRRTAITGMDVPHDLHALLDQDLRSVPLPEDGLLLSKKLADLLHAGPGDVLDAERLTGDQRTFRVPVAAVVEEYLGTSAYARREALGRWTGEGDVLGGVLLSVDPARSDAVGRELKDLPAVASVSYRADQARNLRALLASSQDIMLGVLVTFAGIIVFGVLYNAARIALAERHRELGAMRVLGFTTREVAGLLVGENLLLVAIAIPFGVGLGALFSKMLTSAYETELFRFPFVFSLATVYRSIGFTILFAFLANALVLRPLFRLDLVEVLKARE